MSSSPASPSHSPFPRWAQGLILGALSLCLLTLAVLLRQARATTAQRGKAAPDFTLTLLDGYEYAGQTEVTLAALRGKIVLLHFWGSWCSDCLEESPVIQAAWKKYQARGDVVFLGIAWLDSEHNVRAALQALQSTYPNGLDPNERITHLYNPEGGVPKTYLVDRNGILRYIHVGAFSSAQEIESLLDPMLRE